MNPKETKRLFLKLFIGFLCLTALIAVVTVLSGDFGQFQLKVLASTFSISASCICCMSCAVFIDKHKRKELGLLGMLFSLIAAVLVITGVWSEDGGQYFWKTTASFILFAVAFAHAFLLLIPVLDEKHRWSQKLSCLFIAILTVQILIAIWNEIDNQDYYRLLAVVSIIVVLLTLVIPILLKIRKGNTALVKTLVLTQCAEGRFTDKEGNTYTVNKIDSSQDMDEMN